MSSPSGRDARDAAAQRPLPSVVATAATAAIASSAAAAAYAVLALEWATIIFARYRPFRKGLGSCTKPEPATLFLYQDLIVLLLKIRP